MAAPALSPTRPPIGYYRWVVGPFGENVPRTFSSPEEREWAGAAFKIRSLRILNQTPKAGAA